MVAVRPLRCTSSSSTSPSSAGRTTRSLRTGYRLARASWSRRRGPRRARGLLVAGLEIAVEDDSVLRHACAVLRVGPPGSPRRRKPGARAGGTALPPGGARRVSASRRVRRRARRSRDRRQACRDRWSGGRPCAARRGNAVRTTSRRAGRTSSSWGQSTPSARVCQQVSMDATEGSLTFSTRIPRKLISIRGGPWPTALIPMRMPFHSSVWTESIRKLERRTSAPLQVTGSGEVARRGLDVGLVGLVVLETDGGSVPARAVCGRFDGCLLLPEEVLGGELDLPSGAWRRVVFGPAAGSDDYARPAREGVDTHDRRILATRGFGVPACAAEGEQGRRGRRCPRCRR